MIFYVIILILLVGYRMERRNYCIMATVLLTLFAGLRANCVGTDTVQYQYIYEYGLNFSSLKALLMDRSYNETAAEVGYYILQYLCHQIMDYDGFKVVCAVLTIGPVGYIIYKYSEHPVLSFLIFYMLPIYTLLSMSALRQGIAFGFTLMAFDACFEKKSKFYFGWMAAAFLFHTSSIVLLPLYFLNNIGYKRSYNKLIFIGLIIVAIFSSVIFAYLNSFSRIDYEEGEAGGVGMLVFLCLYFITSYFVSESVFSIGINKFLIYFVAFTIGCWLIGMNLAAIFRLAAYTESFLALYVTNILYDHLKMPTRKLVVGLILLGTLVMMNRLVLKESKGEVNTYYPYYFNWEK